MDGFSKDDMQNTIAKYNWKSPVTGNDLSEPIAFNLMFPTSIGPAGNLKGYGSFCSKLGKRKVCTKVV